MIVELKYTDNQVLAISPDLAEALRLTDGEESWLHLGANKHKVVIGVQEMLTYVALSRQWAAKLQLTPGKWKIRRVADGLRVGPIIGVVCNKLPKRPPAESNWSRYLKALNGGLAILLTPEGLDLERRCVYGFKLSENKLQWNVAELPWPDALYVRAYPVKPLLKTILQKEFPYCHFNSQTLFNKWFIYKSLAKREDIKPYLPETTIFEDNPEKLRSWIEQHSLCYLKPAPGSEGSGVLTISLDSGHYLIKHRESQRNKEITLPATVPIRQTLASIMGHKQYILQKAISLPKNSGRTCDFRILVQKKDDGLWHVTGMFGRRGSVGSIVNNLASGGELLSVARILENGIVPKAQRIREIYQLSFLVATALEQQFPMLGEIGLDFCIDCDDRLWILEVNGRPGHYFSTLLKSPSLARNVYKAPILYATYLSGFSDVVYPLAIQN